MLRPFVLPMAAIMSLACGAAAAQSAMKPSAPQKMTSPGEAKKCRLAKSRRRISTSRWTSARNSSWIA